MIKILKYLNLCFFILMIVTNAAANIMPIGHGTTGEISDKYPNLFTPAGITFFIWGVIYILLLIFSIYQLGVFNDQMIYRTIVELIGPWFIISCIFNIAWLLSWHYDVIWASVVIMVALLITLIIITAKISTHSVDYATGISNLTFFAKLTMCAFDLYLGWITVATIANISVFLVKIDWNRFGLSSQLLTIIMLIIGTVIGVLFVARNQRYMSAIAVIWAYCGILIKHISPSGFNSEYPAIIAVAIIGIVAILSTIVIRLMFSSTATI